MITLLNWSLSLEDKQISDIVKNETIYPVYVWVDFSNVKMKWWFLSHDTISWWKILSHDEKQNLMFIIY